MAENKVLWILQFSDHNWDMWHHLMQHAWVSLENFNYSRDGCSGLKKVLKQAGVGHVITAQ